MRTFRCTCGSTLYFENTQCLNCGKALGFLEDLRIVGPVQQTPAGPWQALHRDAGTRLYRQCRNYEQECVCNWMVPIAGDHEYCRSCRLNKVIPDLRDSKNRRLWKRIEQAKRRLIYTLLELSLSIVGQDEDSEKGLAFMFLADPNPSTEFCDTFGQRNRIKTGHRAGTITINIAEADPSAREEMREKMNEQYRTLLGHFRHEIGHYFWTQLVDGTPSLDAARKLFGDEQLDYATALDRYYREGARPDWSNSYISAYASAHPWEDWAETWAHYMHMIDTLETAHDFGFAVPDRQITHPHPANALAKNTQYTFDRGITFDSLLKDWMKLTVAMNALNRSMGLADAYPFILSAPAVNKLRFVHRLIHEIADT